MRKLGIDTGGTFTDFFLQSENSIQVYKTASTPDDPTRAILKGLKYFFDELPHDLEIVHGTTVATNAFLERKGARTVLVTTYGFEDILTIGRQNRPSLYDFNVERPRKIIPQSCITGVKERIRWDGSIKIPVGKTIGARLRSFCRSNKAESVAVCLLHSYANDCHEKDIKKLLVRLDIPITISSEIHPEFREYERLTTTLINAYLAPTISEYINRLLKKLQRTPLYIQQSNGGILPASKIGERAVKTVLSGPAGGVHGASQLANQINIKKIITFDMGGTSTDVSLHDEAPSTTRDYILDGYPVRSQVMDINTVGAGGGSIVYVDEGEFLKVGPESAGANPGPVCYGKGKQVTVTDANLYLGRLMPNHFLGGSMRLAINPVKKYMAELASNLNLEITTTALGIIKIINASMAQAIRSVSVERGHDPNDFSLFCLGGASGLHCCELAAELGLKTIIIPARAGILSAQGMVYSNPSLDYMQALFLDDNQLDGNHLEAPFKDLVAKGMKEVKQLFLNRGSHQYKNLVENRFLNLRYKGQSYELCVPYEKNFKNLFHRAHEKTFGYQIPDAPLELTSIQCNLYISQNLPELPKTSSIETGYPTAEFSSAVQFESGRIDVPVYLRSNLATGHIFSGPCLIIDDYTTILLTEEFVCRVDTLSNLILEAK